MARSLKVRGILEVKDLRKRVLRQHALGRILRTDKEWLVERLDEIEARIIGMHEQPTDHDV